MSVDEEVLVVVKTVLGSWGFCCLGAKDEVDGGATAASSSLWSNASEPSTPLLTISGEILGSDSDVPESWLVFLLLDECPLMLRELEMDMIAQVCRSQSLSEPLYVAMHVHDEAVHCERCFMVL